MQTSISYNNTILTVNIPALITPITTIKFNTGSKIAHTQTHLAQRVYYQCSPQTSSAMANTKALLILFCAVWGRTASTEALVEPFTTRLRLSTIALFLVKSSMCTNRVFLLEHDFGAMNNISTVSMVTSSQTWKKMSIPSQESIYNLIPRAPPPKVVNPRYDSLLVHTCSLYSLCRHKSKFNPSVRTEQKTNRHAARTMVRPAIRYYVCFSDVIIRRVQL